MTALSHDFVLRRNIRIAFNADDPGQFILSTHGSHHLRLVDAIAALWNDLIVPKHNHKSSPSLRPFPRLPIIASNEVFGLVRSKSTLNYHALIEIKDEPQDDLLDLTLHAQDDAENILRDLNIDPTLLSKPLATAPTKCSSAAAVTIAVTQ
ncbi:hypothetical protein A0H81_06462 [Grifola frondosa]|uniref:Uncharacterized protein n=1 Tax=Grifola frondosa TaxID=5627 RepID=A0A1C7MCP0_GRIFR|nr:hypothetical protein A0H81_06462 [Grifola frondosa]